MKGYARTEKARKKGVFWVFGRAARWVLEFARADLHTRALSNQIESI